MHARSRKPNRTAMVMHSVVWVLMPASFATVAILAIAHLNGLIMVSLLRDPAAVLDAPWHVGALSTVGVTLWAASAAVCLLALRARPADGPRALLVAGATVSLVLGVDDGLLLHEAALPSIGVPSPAAIGVYGIVAVAVFAKARTHLLERRDVGTLALAVGMLAASVIVDGLKDAGIVALPYSALIEDIAKFVGIIMWAAYFSTVAAGVVRTGGRAADQPLQAPDVPPAPGAPRPAYRATEHSVISVVDDHTITT